jgi:alanyl-tRNA synthetase
VRQPTLAKFLEAFCKFFLEENHSTVAKMPVVAKTQRFTQIILSKINSSKKPPEFAFYIEGKKRASILL